MRCNEERHAYRFIAHLRRCSSRAQRIEGRTISMVVILQSQTNDLDAGLKAGYPSELEVRVFQQPATVRRARNKDRKGVNHPPSTLLRILCSDETGRVGKLRLPRLCHLLAHDYHAQDDHSENSRDYTNDCGVHLSRYRAAEIARNGAERRRNAPCQALHCCNGPQGDQGGYQRIFDQILTGLVSIQVL